MKDFLQSISTPVKGILLMLAGVLLLLHTLGIIQAGINTILIIASVALILYGFVYAGFYKKFIKDHENKH